MGGGLVVVSGAGGFVGAQVVKALREAGREVRAVDRGVTELAPLKQLGVACVEGDPMDRAFMARAFRGAKGVIHAAGLEEAGPWEALHENAVDVTARVCEAAREAGADRLVHLSSAGVYGRPKRLPVSEDAPSAPVSDREQVAALAEDRVWEEQRLRGLPASVVRAAWIYGPGSRGLVGSLMALAAVAKEGGLPWLRRLDGGAMGHHVHVEDVARAAILVLDRVDMVGHACNVGDTTPLPWGELAAYVCSLAGVELAPTRLPSGLTKLAASAGAWVPSEKLVGFNRDMLARWGALAAREKLAEDGLTPRVDRDLFAALSADHVYDLKALSSMGFTWRYPRTLAGLRETWDAYQQQRWLPGLPDIVKGA